MVTDSCQDCKGNDIVLAAKGAAELTGVDYNNNPSVQIAWQFESCAPLIQGASFVTCSPKAAIKNPFTERTGVFFE